MKFACTFLTLALWSNPVTSKEERDMTIYFDHLKEMKENGTPEHQSCFLRIYDMEPNHEKLVGEEYEEKMEEASGEHNGYDSTTEAGPFSAVCSGGFAAGYPCFNVDLLSVLDNNELSVRLPLSNNDSNDIWGWSSNGREFALIGLTSGTSFVEITDPFNPIYLGSLPTRGNANSYGNLWRDLKTFNDYVFIVSEISGHGLQIFDLTQLLTASPNTLFTNTATFNGFGSAHNVVINEDTGYLYSVGSDHCGGGLYIVDINDPLNPTYAGCYSGDGYTHDAQCVTYDGPDTTYVGKELCFCSNEDTVTIVDVSIKSSIDLLSRTTYNSDGYTHQGWLTEDHRYFIFNDELDELYNFVSNTRTLVFDVSDLENPSYAGAHSGRTPAIDHNLYVHGGLVYQANYRAGLNVLRIEDMANADFSEAGYFDIYPSSDSSSFNGAWSNYPYFDSGNVIVSGIEQGLFVLRFDQNPTASPTPAPTQTPTITASPTSSPEPTISCFDLDIEILPDDWASGETSWKLYDTDGTTIIDSGGLSEFTDYVLYERTVECLPSVCGSGQSYKWVINDTYGDGLNWSSTAPGYFKIFVGDVEYFGSSDGVNFGSSDTVFVDGCPVTPEPTCLDSTLNVAGTPIGCPQILANNVCDYPGASSHCPLSCDACEEYGCSDSAFPFDTDGGNVIDCDILASFDDSELEFYCTLEAAYSTCRETCNTCTNNDL